MASDVTPDNSVALVWCQGASDSLLLLGLGQEWEGQHSEAIREASKRRRQAPAVLAPAELAARSLASSTLPRVLSDTRMRITSRRQRAQRASVDTQVSVLRASAKGCELEADREMRMYQVCSDQGQALFVQELRYPVSIPIPPIECPPYPARPLASRDDHPPGLYGTCRGTCGRWRGENGGKA